MLFFFLASYFQRPWCQNCLALASSQVFETFQVQEILGCFKQLCKQYSQQFHNEDWHIRKSHSRMFRRLCEDPLPQKLWKIILLFTIFKLTSTMSLAASKLVYCHFSLKLGSICVAEKLFLTLSCTEWEIRCTEVTEKQCTFLSNFSPFQTF